MALPKTGEALGNIHINLDTAGLWLVVTLVYEAAGAGVHPGICCALLGFLVLAKPFPCVGLCPVHVNEPLVCTDRHIVYI